MLAEVAGKIVPYQISGGPCLVCKRECKCSIYKPGCEQCAAIAQSAQRHIYFVSSKLYIKVLWWCILSYPHFGGGEGWGALSCASQLEFIVLTEVGAGVGTSSIRVLLKSTALCVALLWFLGTCWQFKSSLN